MSQPEDWKCGSIPTGTVSEVKLQNHQEPRHLVLWPLTPSPLMPASLCALAPHFPAYTLAFFAFLYTASEFPHPPS